VAPSTRPRRSVRMLQESQNRSTTVKGLVERVDAVEAFIEIAGRLVAVGDLKWVDVEDDYRLLAINVALRRQLESIRAAVVLARQDLGHLAVAFIRASLDEPQTATRRESHGAKHRRVFHCCGYQSHHPDRYDILHRPPLAREVGT
jgi:hypothetical protein